jgi:hypothetical protein
VGTGFASASAPTKSSGGPHGYQIENIWAQPPKREIRKETIVSAHIRVIPVEGVTELPDFAEQAASSEDLLRRRERNELLLLSIATGLSIVLVSCAWVLLALD